MIDEPDIARHWTRLSAVAKRTGRWHHQIHQAGQVVASHFARSKSVRTPSGQDQLSVTAVWESPVAGAVQRAIKWIDEQEQTEASRHLEDPRAQLLVVPSRAIHAIWLESSSRDEIVVVAGPPRAFDKDNLRVLDVGSFHRLLQEVAPAASVRYRPAEVARPRAPQQLIAGLYLAKPSVLRPQDQRLIQNIRWFMIAFILISNAFTLALVAGLTGAESCRVLGVCGLTACAAFIFGGFLGFIFGIPRSLASASAAIAQSPSLMSRASLSLQGGPTLPALSVRPNTNLEEISDWLTKILVGVGLTKIGDMMTAVHGLAALVALPLHPLPNGDMVAEALIVTYVLVGFVWSYFESRTTLMQVFSDESGGQPGEGAPIAADQFGMSGTNTSNATLSASTDPSAVQPATPPSLGPS